MVCCKSRRGAVAKRVAPPAPRRVWSLQLTFTGPVPWGRYQLLFRPVALYCGGRVFVSEVPCGNPGESFRTVVLVGRRSTAVPIASVRWERWHSGSLRPQLFFPLYFVEPPVKRPEGVVDFMYLAGLSRLPRHLTLCDGAAPRLMRLLRPSRREGLWAALAGELGVFATGTVHLQRFWAWECARACGAGVLEASR